MNGDQITVSTEDAEQSTKAKEVVVGDYKGENITVGYNAAYLKDVLSHIGSDKITVQLKSPISAALFIPSVQEEKPKSYYVINADTFKRINCPFLNL